MIRYYLIEEYRRHASIAKKYSLIIFPAYIIFFVAIGASFMGDVLQIFPYHRFIMLTMLSTFIYGIGVSSFEFLGRGRERASLSTVSQYLPITLKHNYLLIFLRDLIYYTLLFLSPAFLGLLISIPFSGFSIIQISRFSLSSMLSMLLGYSVGYLSFSLWHRKRFLYYVLMLFILTYLLLAMLNLVQFPPVTFQIHRDVWSFLLSIATFLVFSLLAYVLTPAELHSDTKRRELSIKRYHRIFKNILVAKEVEDVVRGGILVKSLFTYFLPMLLLLIFVKIININMGREVYNPMSMSVMLSIFSAVIYSWLTILEDYGYIATLPLRASDIVKNHIKVYLLIISIISLPIIIGFNIHSWNLLPWSIGLFYLNSLYLLAITAYIAGPKITSLLFNPGIVIRFSLYSIIPGMLLVIGTFEQSTLSLLTVGITALFMLVLTIYNFKRVEKKWVHF